MEVHSRSVFDATYIRKQAFILSMEVAVKQRRGRKAKVVDTQANCSVVADYHIGTNKERTENASIDLSANVTIFNNQVLNVTDSNPKQHVILRIKQQVSQDNGDEVPSCTPHGNPHTEPVENASNTYHVVGSLKRNNTMLSNVNCDERMIPDKSVCFWCCHSLHNNAIGLPLKYKGEKYHVCGCFCSFECAAAFNFNSRELHQDQWKSYNLLNEMALAAGYQSVVQPAPSKYALKLFGGWMDIVEFRANNKLINPLPSPMMSIVQFMEEIMSSDIMHGSLPSQQVQPMFVPLDQERVNRAKQNLIASTKGKKNSIHDKMNLRVGRNFMVTNPTD